MPVTVRGTDILFNNGTTQSTAAGAPTTAQVLAATAAAGFGAVGTYAWMRSLNTVRTVPGNTKAGSNLRAAGLQLQTNPAVLELKSSGTAIAGTWRCMGFDDSGVSSTGYGNLNFFGITLWLRIS